jgi:hypothetical protein
MVVRGLGRAGVDRSKIDGYVLEMLSSRTFGPRDFGETRRGICRIFAALTHELAGTRHSGRPQSHWSSKPRQNNSPVRTVRGHPRSLVRMVAQLASEGAPGFP